MGVHVLSATKTRQALRPDRARSGCKLRVSLGHDRQARQRLVVRALVACVDVPAGKLGHLGRDAGESQRSARIDASPALGQVAADPWKPWVFLAFLGSLDPLPVARTVL